MKILILIAVLGSLVSCSFFNSEKPPRDLKALLSEDYARARSEKISDVTYQLKFDLTDEKSFSGTTAVHFNLKEKMFVSLDFVNGHVLDININGQTISAPPYNGYYIELPEEYLKIGKNSVLINYTHAYSKNGAGLYKYVDVKDNRVYLYSNFEPYHANQLFPCFDQPDLKAHYTTQVLAPKGWHVITATRETEKVEKGQYEQWFFPQSSQFSTYTYSLHAGEYEVWEDVAKTKNHEIPLRLFARKSLAAFVKTDDWFTWTKQGFDFFESYYSYPYPYTKYDQVLVPDFNHGAMENVAAVTFNEDRYVTKGDKTREQRRKLATTLFHEMAHMWFGNLVTMKWWDDLWLNESFATYSSYVGLMEVTEFKEAWKIFNSRKQQSYRQDQSATTHPIAQGCAHTQAAFANFDSITYGKGASVLKQLSYLLGEKTYRKALKKYFTDFATKNTTLADFMGTMEQVSGKELKSWEQRWLKTEMLNQVEVFFTCQRGRIDHFEIYQTGTQQHPTLRTHKTRVALFRRSGGVYKLNTTHAVEYSGGQTRVKKMEGRLCPDIVYPNYEDHDYVVVHFDKKSLQNIEANLVTLQDPFIRSVIWSDLWAMVLNQEMSMNRYLEIVEFNGLVEKDLDILSDIFNNVEVVLKEYFPDAGQPWVAKRDVWVKFFEQAIITKMYENIDEPTVQRHWFGYLVQVAESPKVLRLLEKVVKRHRSGLPINFEVGQDLRWDILNTLVAHNYKGAVKLVALEQKRDPSKRGELKALLAESLQPSLQNKKKMFSRLLAKKEELSFGTLRTIMAGLFPSQQKAFHRKFVDSFYKNLSRISESGEEYFASEFAETLVPTFCDQKSSTQISKYLAAEKDLSFPVVKTLQAALFENQRCYKMRKVLKGDDAEMAGATF